MLYTMVRERKKMVNFIDVQEAVRQYGPGVMGEGPQLPHPLCGQCVVTDGRNMTPMWLQVSNLNVREEEEEGSGGNLVAVKRLGPLYEDTDMVRGRKKRKVVDFNENTQNSTSYTLDALVEATYVFCVKIFITELSCRLSHMDCFVHHGN